MTADIWICQECSRCWEREDLIEAPHPFQTSAETLLGCPDCRSALVINKDDAPTFTACLCGRSPDFCDPPELHGHDETMANLDALTIRGGK